MIARVTVILVLFGAGCFDDRYRCTSDEQCDLGMGGRCEADGSCTSFDLTCTTNFRYAEHSGELTNTCFDDRVEIANACAGGQGPARPVGCIATVCGRLPMCCDIGWTDACAQVAEEECDLRCDTRIALTAARNGGVETWDLRWDGTSWFAIRETALSPLAWVAPAPGLVEPRRAGVMAGSLVVGDAHLPIQSGRSYDAITSVSFDREGIDTIAASYSGNGQVVDLMRVGDGSTRTEQLPASELLTWGDLNRDGFPDAIAKDGANYRFYENVAAANFTRKISNPTSAPVSGGLTPGAPAIRSIDWLDFTGDGLLDLVVFGNSVRMHTSADMIRDVADRELDCSPPNLARSCMNSGEPDLEHYSFVGGALPSRDQPEIVFAQFPDRKLWRAHLKGDAFFVAQLPFPNDGCSCQSTCMAGNCTYDCTNCVPILWVGSRDLDFDHKVDLIAIDARLRIFTALAASNFMWKPPFSIPTPTMQTFVSVTASVTGAPTP